MKNLIDKLFRGDTLSRDELSLLIENHQNKEISAYLFEKARQVSLRYFDHNIYMRGLIEFTNYCKNDCYYCGLRKSNKLADRYRLSKKEILDCCALGYDLGFRTFVLQGGEDGYYKDRMIADIVSTIRTNYPDCAITLSVGERSFDSYKMFFEAGADRYLLRHETANADHYARLHPPGLSLRNRKECLYYLKEIGYQVGCGFMVGAPFQTKDYLIDDLLFIKEFQPHMVGIGPFIPHHDTPFAHKPAGTLELTLFLLAIIRLMLPGVLLPATTALGTIHPQGRELGILAGANVVMPNISPVGVRKKYLLYDHKICTEEEADACKNSLQHRLESIGYKLVVSRGDYKFI
ncbi:MAG: [FeFe] hydrogenase H-cluster radical SAM maturase HydE [Bacillota bacterium]|nr:[FeFe] hydrogenase H-cluster radical SAM maturase HydE [Clostridia bacterium]